MEPKTRQCVKCGTPVLFEPPYICGKCSFENEPWFDGGLPIVVFALTFRDASDCAAMNNITVEAGQRWFYLDNVERLFGLRRAVIWRFEHYYLRNDLLKVEQYISTRGYTYVEAPIQHNLKRGK